MRNKKCLAHSSEFSDRAFIRHVVMALPFGMNIIARFYFLTFFLFFFRFIFLQLCEMVEKKWIVTGGRVVIGPKRPHRIAAKCWHCCQMVWIFSPLCSRLGNVFLLWRSVIMISFHWVDVYFAPVTRTLIIRSRGRQPSNKPGPFLDSFRLLFSWILQSFW